MDRQSSLYTFQYSVCAMGTACLCLIGRQTKFYRATPSGVVKVHEDSSRVTRPPTHFSVVLALATSPGNHCHVYNIRIDRFKNHE